VNIQTPDARTCGLRVLMNQLVNEAVEVYVRRRSRENLRGIEIAL
jgi:hypothetical protein